MISQRSQVPSSLSLDPWLAVNYALIFPGLGQLYSRHWWKGGGLVAIALSLLLYSGWSIFAAPGSTLHGFWAIGLLVVVYSFSILDAYRGTQANYATRISIPQGRKDVWYAVFLSQLLPGLGHLYAQQALIGGLFLLTGLMTAWLANQQPLLVPLPPAVWALSCHHIYRAFPQRSPRQPAVIALLVLGLFLTRLAIGNAPHWVNQTWLQSIVLSESMVPTLQVSDRLFVRRDQPDIPVTGDIVVFQPPDALRSRRPNLDPDDLFVKRIIGQPNEWVEIKHRQVFIAGQPLAEPYVRMPPDYEWGPAQVPADSYFVLGDNRNESNDSHIWGYLPADKIVGRAYKIYWPPSRVQALPSGPEAQSLAR
ncbi:MAG: signal peptidase I [Leptolyngbya sp. SIOISBB]|nr:signal peptidase I [Leptolyngbya sp. SIOISBB]